ncbi:unnamed protein product [Rotaria sordida]|nr:unnamed protein product [Rotaria sordida]CAF4030446.1 unnamed protein product [Rotaria sordida]
MISEEKGGPGHLIFTDTEKLSRAFQSSACCLQDVFCAAEAIIHRFRRIQVVQDSEGLTEKPILPRLRRPPRRYESNTIPKKLLTCFNSIYTKEF